MTSRRGLTLIEALLAAAIGAAVLTLAALAFGATGRIGSEIGSGSADAQRRTLAVALLRHEIESAGRGEPSGGLEFELDPSGEGGDRIRVRYLAEADRAEPVRIDAVFDARQDGRGRWNLYRTPVGSVRQPWLLGVAGLHLVEGRRADGRAVARTALAEASDLNAVLLELRFDDGTTASTWASTERSSDGSRATGTAPEAAP